MKASELRIYHEYSFVQYGSPKRGYHLMAGRLVSMEKIPYQRDKQCTFKPLHRISPRGEITEIPAHEQGVIKVKTGCVLEVWSLTEAWAKQEWEGMKEREQAEKQAKQHKLDTGTKLTAILKAGGFPAALVWPDWSNSVTISMAMAEAIIKRVAELEEKVTKAEAESAVGKLFDNIDFL